MPEAGVEGFGFFIFGDAVYTHFDGFGLDLKLNSHENECVVYLEPEVMQNLIEFWKAIVEEK